MEQFLEIVKVFGSMGLIGILVKFIIDRILSTQIEFSIETNYSRAFREFFNLIILIIYIGFIFILVYFLFDTSSSNKYDVITTAHYSFSKKEMRAVIDLNKKNKLIETIYIYISLILVISIIYGYFRSMWYKNYRRRVYVRFANKKFYVLKRISKDKILFTDEKNTYKIIGMSELKDEELKTETIRERQNTRYRYYYRMINRLVNYKEFKTSEKIIYSILLLIVFIFLILVGLTQEKKLFFFIGMLTMLISIYLFFRRQYVKGKRLINNRSLR